jgi:hypothetical protein
MEKIETVNTNNLKIIIANLRTILKDNNISPNILTACYGVDPLDGLETIMRKYLGKVSKNNTIKVRYNQIDGHGRFFADHALSLQSIKREIRQTICNEFYDDIDMVNAHPVILLYLCKKENLETPYLEKYVNDRDKVLDDTGLSRDQAKQSYLVMVNADECTVKCTNEHMKGFNEEMIKVHKYFVNRDKREYLKNVETRRQKGKFHNNEGAYVNNLMCQMENEILMCIHEYFKSPSDCVLCFDGIMLRKGTATDKTIKACMRVIKKKHGIDMKLKMKPMEELIDLSKYGIPTAEDLEDDRVYRVCKELPPFTRQPMMTFDRKYICDYKNTGISYFGQTTHNIVLKSDTGTGKTSAFVNYIKQDAEKFISVGSRISLCDQQYRSMKDDKIDVVHYNLHHGEFVQTDNIIIMLDSIIKLDHFDFSDYVVYLDEFGFLIEYLLTSDTMCTKRILVMRMFNKMLTQSKRIICTDADIGEICLQYFDKLGISYQFQKNAYLKCNGVEAVELQSREIMLDMIRKLDKFLICTDSKTEAEALSKDLNDPKIVTYTSDYRGSINLDDNEKSIISPKVITGVDSVMQRHVFAIYKEHTITADHMIQQLNRCRNIVKIYYFFPNKKVTPPKYESVEQVTQMISREDEVYNFKNLATDLESRLYCSLYASTLYNWDCVATNKFLHFKKTLTARGVVDSTHHIGNSKEKMTTRAELIKEKIENFDTSKYKDTVNEEGETVVGINHPVNEILQIPGSELDNFKQYLIDDIKLSNHFNFCNFMFKDTEFNKLNDTMDFNTNKATSAKGKIHAIRKICETYGIDCKTNFKVIRESSKEINEQLANMYTTVFRYRGKKLDFSKPDTVLKTITASMRTLFGRESITSSRVGKKMIYVYSIDKDFLELNKKLFNFRQDNTVQLPTNEDAKKSLKVLQKKLFK